MIKSMKSLLKFLGVLVVFFVWVELINLSFYLMDLSDTFVFYCGVLLLSIITMGPIFYFGDNIAMFLKNMKGVFFDKEEKK
jgi:CBS domain containing-hemolysin-like protein